jgi:Uma2 family endonuclease
VLEVILPTSASHEHVRKLAAYERAGVSAYWLVHPVDRIRGIYRLEGECYARLRVVEPMEETPLGAAPAVVVRWGPS